MSTKETGIHLRIDTELKDAIEKDSVQKNVASTNQYIIDALQHFLDCKKGEPSQAMHLLITKYTGVCIKCRHEVEKGSWALYGKGVGIICLDCYISKLGDKALLAKFLKNRELDRIRKVLQDQTDRLAQKVEAYQGIEKLDLLVQQQDKVTKLVQEYLTAKLGSAEEKQCLEEIIRQTQVTSSLIRDMEEFIQKYLKNRKWLKQVKQTEGEYAQQ